MISLLIIERLRASYPALDITTEETPRSVIVNGIALDLSPLLLTDLLEKFHSLTEAHQEEILGKIGALISAEPVRVRVKAPTPIVEPEAPVVEPAVEAPVAEPEATEPAVEPVAEAEAPAPKTSKKKTGE